MGSALGNQIAHIVILLVQGVGVAGYFVCHFVGMRFVVFGSGNGNRFQYTSAENAVRLLQLHAQPIVGGEIQVRR